MKRRAHRLGVNEFPIGVFHIDREHTMKQATGGFITGDHSTADRIHPGLGGCASILTREAVTWANAQEHAGNVAGRAFAEAFTAACEATAYRGYGQDDDAA